MNNQLISIVLTTYSRPTNLCRAIDSVLSQTYKPIEIIVVDDNGEGTEYQLQTEKILENYINSNSIVYIKHKKNLNGSAARNTGVKASKGFFVGLLDDDDEFSTTKVETQINTLREAMKSDPQCQGCYCNTRMDYGSGKIGVRNNLPTNNLSEALLLGISKFNTSTFLCTKESYLSINGFDERFLRHQDWEFFIRYLSRYKMVLPDAPAPLITKHITPNAITRDPHKLIQYKEFFLEQMHDYIYNLSCAEKIMYRQYMDLSLGLTQYGFFADAFSYLRKANHYKRVTIEDMLQIVRRIIRFIKK